MGKRNSKYLKILFCLILFFILFSPILVHAATKKWTCNSCGDVKYSEEQPNRESCGNYNVAGHNKYSSYIEEKSWKCSYCGTVVYSALKPTVCSNCRKTNYITDDLNAKVENPGGYVKWQCSQCKHVWESILAPDYCPKENTHTSAGYNIYRYVHSIITPTPTPTPGGTGENAMHSYRCQVCGKVVVASKTPTVCTRCHQTHTYSGNNVNTTKKWECRHCGEVITVHVAPSFCYKCGAADLIMVGSSGGSSGGNLNGSDFGMQDIRDEQNSHLGAKSIYYDSAHDLLYFEMGENETLAKLRYEFEEKNGKVEGYKGHFLKYLNDEGYFEKFDLQFNMDDGIPFFPHCIVFDNYYIDGNNKKRYYIATAWLYLYCSENEFDTDLNTRSTLLNKDLLPMYFEEGEPEGTSFIAAPGKYFYYPVSSMKLPEYGHNYISQVLILGENELNSSDAEITNTVKEKLDKYYQYFAEGKKPEDTQAKVHTINDFSAANGRGTISLFEDIELPANKAWMLAFCNSTMVENCVKDKVGDTGYAYPLQKRNLYNEFNSLVGTDLGNTLSVFMNYNTILGNTKNNTAAFTGMKNKTTSGFIDPILGGAVNSSTIDPSGLVDVKATFDNIYSNLRKLSGGGNKGLAPLNKTNINEVYGNSKVINPTADSSHFCHYQGSGKDFNMSLRYVWAAAEAGIGGLLDDGGLNIANDYSPTSMSGWFSRRNPLTNSETQLKNNKMISSYSDKGRSLYAELDNDSKVKNNLIFFQYNPELIPSVAASSAREVSGVKNKIGTGANSIKKLNELAQTDYEGWKDVLIQMGDAIVEHSLSSGIPIRGLSVNYTFLASGGGYYNSTGTGLSIAQGIHTTESVSDFVLSNSYNTSESSYALENSNDDAFVRYNPTARNVIDWMHGATDIPSDGNIAATHGGQNGVYYPKEETLATTLLDPNSSYKMFDIKCSVAKGGQIFGSLDTGQKNYFRIDPTSNLAPVFDTNPEAVSFDTFIYVGRIPEAEEDDITVGDVQVLGKAIYNNFEVEFNPSNDDTKTVRTLTSNYLKDGSAVEALSGYFSALNSDYNTKLIFDIYKNGGTDYQNQKTLQVRAVPTLIMDVTNLDVYQKELYPEYGYAMTVPLTASPWRPVDENEKFKPGSVVAYRFDYRMPNSNTIESQKILDASVSMLRMGQWYNDYGSVLCADIDFWISPKLNSSNTKKVVKNNLNMNNDYVSMRVQAPLMDNIYFTSVEVSGIAGGSSKYTATPYIDSDSGIKMTMSGQGSGQIWETKIGNSSLVGGGQDSMSFGAGSITVGATWQYWCRGKSVMDVNPALYNYINYFNGFKLASGIISANSVALSGDNSIEMTMLPGHGVLTVNPNEDFMNAAKEKSIRIQVPKNECNDYIKDWELIVLNFDVPEKDNAVVDLVLKGSDGNFYGNVSRAGGDKLVAQQIPKELSGGTLYAVVQRLAPAMYWREVSKSSEIHCHFTLNVDGTEINSPGNLFTGNINGHVGTALGGFTNPGHKLIYSIPIGGKFSYLSAIANFRNLPCCYDYEDINMTNNYWTEIWESTFNPNFVLDIVDGQPDIKKTIQLAGNPPPECPVQPPVEVSPYLIFTVAQTNPNAKGSWQPYVHVNFDGVPPKTMTGVSYLGNGKGTVTFNGGDTSPKTVHAVWDIMRFSWGTNSSNNRVFEAKPHINYGDCLVYSDETNLLDNTGYWDFNVNLTCNRIITGDECCIFDKRVNRNAKMFYGAGKTYEWDVFFMWSQLNDKQFESDCINPGHVYGCTHVTKYQQTGVTDKGHPIMTPVEWHPSHEHCYCYCGGSQSPGPNNNVRKWRSELGYGMYYERFNIHIYVDSSAHGKRDIAGGSTRIYAGETFSISFETTYESNRGDVPLAPNNCENRSPYSNQGDNPSKPKCCKGPCNYLTREPGTLNVTGPYFVDIKLSGSSSYDFSYKRITPHAYGSNSAHSKRYIWRPIPDEISVSDTQMSGTCWQLYLCNYDFLGHVEDTYQVNGNNRSKNAYAWQQRDTQAYCDARTGIICFVKSKTYIGSGMESEGLDVSSGGQTNNNGYVDGDIWIQ